MKKVLIGLGIIALLLVGVFLFAVSQAGTIISQLQPELEKQISGALGSDFSVKNIDLSVFPSTRLELDQVSLIDPKNPEKSLTMERGLLKVSLFALLSGNLKVDTFELIKPQITMRQRPNGISIDGVPIASTKNKKGKKSGKREKTDEKPPAKPVEAAPPLPSWLAINLNNILIQDASLKVMNQSPKGKESTAIELEDIDFQSAISLAGDTIQFKNLTAHTIAKGKAVVDLVSSVGSFNMKTTEISLPDGKCTISAKKVGALTASLSDFKGNVTTQVFDFPDITLKLLGGSVSLQGNYVLPTHTGQIDVTTNLLKYQGVDLGFKGSIDAKDGNFVLSNTALTLDKSSTNILGKSSPLTATIPFEGSFNLTKPLLVEKALKLTEQSSKIPFKGTLKKFTANAKGTAKPDLQKTLKANAEIELVDGEYTGGNLLKLLIQAMKDIPFLNRELESSIPPEHKEAAKGDTTPIASFTASTKIENSTIIVQSLALQSDTFSLTANGTIGFDTSLDLVTTFRFSKSFTESFTAKVKELDKLVDKDGQLTIPLAIKGKATKPLLLPNMKEIMKLGAGKAIKKEASKLLGKMLGSKKEDTPEGQPSKEEKIVEDVGKIFGF